MNYKTLIYPQEDNVLCYFKEKNIYIMDKHRLALWCWINEIDKNDYSKYALIHIDDHFDCGGPKSVIEKMMKKIDENGIEYYKNLDYFRFDEINEKQANERENNYKTFLDGSYLIPAIFLEIFNNSNLHFFVKQDLDEFTNNGMKDNCVMNGKVPDINYFQKKCKDPTDNSEEGYKKLKELLKNWDDFVINIDFDYFFEFLKGRKAYIKKFFNLIKRNQKKIKLMTIALTPCQETRWKESEDVLIIFNKVFDLKIKFNCTIISIIEY
ncbi:MAG: UPF0489 family protein [Candidatus Paceibacterota bacterium]|jgi:hypothetical protein